MKIVALELDGKVYEVVVSDVFDTNDVLKANIMVDFEIDIDDCTDFLKTLADSRATVHGLYLDHHIVIEECELDFERMYENGFTLLFLHSETMPVWGDKFKEIVGKIPVHHDIDEIGEE